MTEENLNQGVINEEVANPSSQVSEESSEVKQAAGNDKEYNFKQLRETNEDLKRQVSELRDFVNSKENIPQEKPAPQEDELLSLSPDDIVTYGQVDRLAEKKAREIVDKVFQERETAELPKKVKAQYSDFDEIVNKETVKEFEQSEPALASACAVSANPYEATYKMLKILRQQKTDGKIAKNEEIIDRNLKVPPPATSISRSSGLQDANSFGELSQADLYKEMMQFSRKSN